LLQVDIKKFTVHHWLYGSSVPCHVWPSLL